MFILATAQQSLEKAQTKINETAEEYRAIAGIANEFVQNFWERLPYLIVATAIFLLFWGISHLFKKLVVHFVGEENRYKHSLIIVVRRLGSAGILFIGFMMAMLVALPNFTPTKLMGALGIGSVAIGFAFKDIFQNLLSGILLLLSEPFRIGDQIVVKNFEGVVEDIEIRATVIRTYDGRQVVIPNSEIYTSAVTVNTAYPNRRLEFDVGISYDDDINLAKQVIRQSLDDCPSVSKEAEPSVIVTELADWSINIRVRWYISDGTQARRLASLDEVITKVKEALDSADIEIPYPTEKQVRIDDIMPKIKKRLQNNTNVSVNTFDKGEDSTPKDW